MKKYIVIRDNSISRVVVTSDKSLISLEPGERLEEAVGKVRRGDAWSAPVIEVTSHAKPKWPTAATVATGVAGAAALGAAIYEIFIR